MGIRNFIKKFAGRKGKATHGGTPDSHVNHKRNKRAANRGARHSQMIDEAFHEDESFIDITTDEEPH
jgi:hypothetical protein